MDRKFRNVLVTGGCGFIGANFIRYLFGRDDFTGNVINLDALTYAGNPENVRDIEERHGGGRYRFVKGDIVDGSLVGKLFGEHDIDTVVHFAAESHVDRSITGPKAFVVTNIEGTFTLLEAARSAWQNRGEDVLFHHVSTDEVFGSLGPEGFFRESTPYDPRSPYSASKAASDHLVRSYHHTFGLPVTVSNCSNNYGPYQFPEKLVPLMILNMLDGKPLPVYGEGRNIRDWLYVEDHADAIWTVMKGGRTGETYVIGGESEYENIALLHLLCDAVAEATGERPERYRDLITFVKDRPGHDRRYAIDCSRIKSELNWRQSVSLQEGLEKTVAWYLDNRDWVERVRNGSYREWIELNYRSR